MNDRILIVDDEEEILTILEEHFEELGFDVQTAENGDNAWAAISESVFDLVISDMSMQPVDGMELLKRIRTIDDHLPFIIMTGVGTIENAVEAIQMGAFHYITKPFKINDLEIMAHRAIEHGKLHRKLEDVNSKIKTDTMVVGSSPAMRQVMERVKMISDSEASILIQGETGTGKSLLAKHIHSLSLCKDKPFFVIDCGALSENLLESELFGHVKGAFTGAIKAKRGQLEEAQGGTVFLDEIGELTPSTQIKLLRAIQEKEIKPVGGNRVSKIDARFISATSRNLDNEIERGNFREELYYRLSVIPLYLPALRERKEDIILFVNHFIPKFNKIYNKNVTDIDFAALQNLNELSWKGNIRELENMIERAVLFAENSCITLPALSMNSFSSIQPQMEEPSPTSLKKAVEKAETMVIKQAIASVKGNRSKAAKLLGISRSAFYKKLESYGL